MVNFDQYKYTGRVAPLNHLKSAGVNTIVPKVGVQVAFVGFFFFYKKRKNN